MARIARRAIAAWLALTLLGLACCQAAGEAWPALPEADADVTIPAQEWPLKPGPRTVKVTIRYPGGALKNVGRKTGLMLSNHNWGGTRWTGTVDPKALANRYDVVGISLDYLQSGTRDKAIAYDYGYLQALDALRALAFAYHGLIKRGTPFARGRIYATGGSGGGNVSLMANKLAPRTFACIIDMSGMARLTDDIAFGLPSGSTLNAGYSNDPKSPNHLTTDAQAIRWPGHPLHLKRMKRLGNTCKVIISHGTTDSACPCDDAREAARNMKAAGLDVEPHFVTKADLDGKVLTNTGHSVGNRTLICFHWGDRYLKPDSPKALARKGRTDLDLRDEKVRYRTPNGGYIISYKAGYPVGRFVRK